MFNKFLHIDTLSIKKLTLLGFSLVALPLVFALIYSAAQVNLLSKEGESAIFNAAQLTKINRDLSETLTKMERYASQYIVLNDQELINSYSLQEQHVLNMLADNLTQYSDNQLQSLSQTFQLAILNIHQLLKPESLTLKSSVSKNKLSIELPLITLQKQFKHLAKLNQDINLRSNEIISLQASQIKTSAVQVRSTMLNSLIIIPITIAIAVFFIIVITKPLKKLATEIQTLEQGNFEKKITLKSSPEINEIVDALEIMRTRLHALELQKSSFIRHISHELKTPLAAIREGTELLYDNSVGTLNEEQQEISNIIRTSVNRLQRLIEDLLDFNIVLDSTSLQDSKKLQMKQVFNHVVNERKLDIKRKKLIINSNFDNIYIHSNTKQLTVILDNLLSNAIKYSPENGVINIDSELKNSQLIFTISDQGPGIEAEQASKIFDAFYQGTPPNDNQIKGSGLGLTIVKELLMRINGSIIVKSNLEQPTSTSITVELPRAYRLGENQ